MANVLPIMGKWDILMYAYEFDEAVQMYVHTSGGRSGHGWLEMGYWAQCGQYYALGRILPGLRDELIVGFALRPQAGSPGYDFITFGRSGWSQCSAMISSTGEVCGMGYRNGYVGTTGGGQYQATIVGRTAPNSAPMNVWHYWEFHVSNGSMQVQRDGQLVATWSHPAIHAPYDTFYLGKINGQDAGYANYAQWRYDFDDLYLIDTLDPPPNAFLGDVEITTIWPRGAGSNTEWVTQPSGTPNWYAVSDPIPDDDGSLITTDAAAQIDSYQMQHLPDAPISGAQYTYWTRSVPGTTPKLVTLTRRSGSERQGTYQMLPMPDYSFVTTQYGYNPLSGAPWVADDFNDPTAEHGVVLIP
jgi:hypothetical protein